VTPASPLPNVGTCVPFLPLRRPQVLGYNRAMQKRQLASIAVLFCLLPFLLSGTFAQTTKRAPASARHGQVVYATVHAKGLEGNLLGDPADQTMGVYLPPSYSTHPSRRYPVLYLLHGFGGSGAGWFQSPEAGSPRSAPLLQNILDDAMTEGGVREMIVATPNGRNKLVGSFYLDSSVAGDWEDYVVRDVVGYVDAHYRTLADRDARGLAGFSMGGFGALVLGARHSDVFGVVYAMSPCCTAMREDLTEKNPAWQTLLRIQGEHRVPSEGEAKDFYVDAFWALAAAVSPDRDRAGLLADLPYKLEDGKVVQDPAVYRIWEEKLPLTVLPAHADQLRGLIALKIEYGMQDDFPAIPVGAREVSAALAAKGVPHVLETFTGTHMDHLPERLRHMLPFMSENLRH